LKKIIFLSLFFNFCSISHAKFPYDLPYDINKLVFKDIITVSNMPPVKSQDGVGLCYSFTATNLLENFRCNELKLDCNDKSQQISILDTASFYDPKMENLNSRKIKEIAATRDILLNINKFKPKLAKEECVSFSFLVYEISSNQRILSSNEKNGWNYLVQAWTHFREQKQYNSENLLACTANNIKNELLNLSTSKNQIIDALKTASNLEQFLFKTILPSECLLDKNLLYIPDFEVKHATAFSDTPTELEQFKEQLKFEIGHNIPVEITICNTELVNNKCPHGRNHSVVLNGIKQACEPNFKGCKTMVKIQNSFGQRWQELNNDGWADLETIINANIATSPIGMASFIWIQKPQ
jgi:hypothetical protein